MASSIVEAVLDHAQRRPARPAVFFEGATITYARLWTEIERFALALGAWGLRRGDRVALFLENRPEFVTAYLGAQLAGGVVVLVNTAYRQVELGHIMTDAGVRLCVTSAAGAAELRRLELPALEALVIVSEGDDAPASGASGRMAFDDFVERAGPLAASRPEQPDADFAPPPPLTLPGPDDPAVIGYTSGTTGRAKGALLLHRNLIANIAAIAAAWRWTADDHLLLTLPLFHTHGLLVGLHGTLYTGARATLRRKFDAADVLDTLARDPSVTLFFGVPTMYARLLAEAERRGVPAHLPRLFVSGSAPLSAQLFGDFERVFGQRILERYGMTETGMNLTHPRDGERRAGTVGAPFPGQEARVVHVRTREPLPPGEIGEIEVRGPHVFAGYWNRPDATAEAFDADGWFKTGDLGWVSDDGYYTITGRARELIISGGYNIYPRELEDVLAQHPGVAEVAVLGLPDPEMGEQVVAVVVPRPDAARPSVEDLIAFSRERLASYKKPRRVVFAETLPRNALGKVQKHLLAARLAAK